MNINIEGKLELVKVSDTGDYERDFKWMIGNTILNSMINKLGDEYEGFEAKLNIDVIKR